MSIHVLQVPDWLRFQASVSTNLWKCSLLNSYLFQTGNNLLTWGTSSAQTTISCQGTCHFKRFTSAWALHGTSPAPLELEESTNSNQFIALNGSKNWGNKISIELPGLNGLNKYNLTKLNPFSLITPMTLSSALWHWSMVFRIFWWLPKSAVFNLRVTSGQDQLHLFNQHYFCCSVTFSTE